MFKIFQKLAEQLIKYSTQILPVKVLKHCFRSDYWIKNSVLIIVSAITSIGHLSHALCSSVCHEDIVADIDGIVDGIGTIVADMWTLWLVWEHCGHHGDTMGHGNTVAGIRDIMAVLGIWWLSW